MEHQRNRGFTLIEILVVIGMIGILAATVLVAVNPLHQFAQARNAQRISNVNALLNAVSNRIADNGGMFSGNGCDRDLPTEAMIIGTAPLDIRNCLVPTYIPELPFDPSAGHNTCRSDECGSGDYDTGYTVKLSESHRITICAPHSTDDGMSEPYCLTR